MSKHFFRTAALAAALLVGGVPALTADEAPAPAPVSAPEAGAPAKTEVAVKDDDRIVCKTVAITGTRFTQRLCDKKSAWDNRRKVDREATDDLQRSVLTACFPTAEGLCGN